MKFCTNCNKEIEQHLNYCSWDCNIEAAKKEGGKAHTPNGLPIACIKADGTMLEHEHGGHPDYKFVIEIEFVGERPKLPEWDHSYTTETHALIYTDGVIAVTMYECCYATWYLNDGHNHGGRFWKEKGLEWRMTKGSILLCQELALKDGKLERFSPTQDELHGQQ